MSHFFVSGRMPAVNRRILGLGIGFILVSSGPPADAAVHVVSADGTGNYSRIQEAIDASASGDTVRIGPGNYEEHLVIAAKDLVLEGPAGAEATVLDGQRTGRVLGVFSSPSGVVLRGLTIQYGTTGGVEADDQGGGVAVYETALVVEDCVFRYNHASSLGGGLHIGTFAPAGSPPTPPSPATPSLKVVRTRFVENVSTGSGGGVHCDEVPSLILDSAFEGNHAGQTGGGIDFLQGGHFLEGCEFRNNTAFLGAGAAVSGRELLNLVDCTFTGNFADGGGGGVWSVNGGGVLLEKVRFFGNQAHRGGAMSLARAPLLAHRVLFRNNRASDRGGAVHLDDVGSAQFGYTTWFGNDAPSGASLWTYAGNLRFEYSIVADESPAAVRCFGGSSVTTTCTVGGPTTGNCLTFIERRNLEPCGVAEDLLCSVPSPGDCGPVGYAETSCPSPHCSTPARPATWGFLKGLYRP